MSTTTCQQIKAKLTLREAARMAGINLHLKDNIKFCSPIRPDRNPSCTIKGDLFTDWSTGQHLDAIDFYAAAKNISQADAIRELGQHFGLTSEQRAGKVHVGGSSNPQPDACVVVAGADLIEKPGEPDEADFEAIRASRLLPEGTGGLELAHDVGVLRFGKVCGFLSWIVTDNANRIAEARRLNGELFPQQGELGPRKSHTLRGSKKGWPCGLLPSLSPDRLRYLRSHPLVLVEGGPDLLAAYCILASFPGETPDVHPVAMLGANASISDEALALMAGRPVVILCHGDKAGRDAAQRWRDQLVAAKCAVKRRELPESKDLNDLCVNRTTLTPLIPYLLP
jgi:hypothetical protein